MKYSKLKAITFHGFSYKTVNQCRSQYPTKSKKDLFGSDDIKIINSLIKNLNRHPKFGLKYHEVDYDSLELLVFSNSSVVVNNNRSSQVGFIILLENENRTVSLMYFSSDMSRRVIISVLGAETFGLEDAFDEAIVIRHKLNNNLGRTKKIKSLVQSETLFNVIIGIFSATERRKDNY